MKANKQLFLDIVASVRDDAREAFNNIKVDQTHTQRMDVLREHDPVLASLIDKHIDDIGAIVDYIDKKSA